ncbi:hypothetical protein [Pimelobacter simplex]|uniref:hypothetical protein n=1 Tax=Nocardioides simplex TaxID=2045 RepID=UPI002150306F|nr:hypothetical protein [Pimelobacter simplex]UUW89424.1 hypothetical protein M0M43_27400 [Pimelobacter simplex]UUW93252.1 hypothetical protein M0M48_16050 [Pimelobacter simplex]
MPDPFVRWYVAGAGLPALVARLRRAGLALDAPGAPGTVSVLDAEGDRVPTGHAEFEACLRSPETGALTFQLWFSGSEDLVLSWSRLPDATGNRARHCVVAFLDGLSVPQADAVVAAVEETSVASPADTVALVVDLGGRTAEVDWLAVLDAPDQAPWVDRLVVDQRLLDGASASSWDRDRPAVGLATRRDAPPGGSH